MTGIAVHREQGQRVSALARRVLAVALLASLPAAAAAQTFSAAGLSITFGPDGKVSSLIDTVANCERVGVILPPHRVYACRVQYAGEMHDPTSFISIGTQLIYNFGTIPTSPSVTVTVTAHPRYLVFTLSAISNTSGIEKVDFVNLRMWQSTTDSLMRFLSFNNCNAERRLGLYPLDIFTQTKAGGAGKGDYLRASAEPGLPWTSQVPMVGRKAALFTCADDRESILSICERVETDYGIPLGAAAKRQSVLRSSQFFWMDLTHNNGGEALQYTMDSGFQKVLLSYPVWADSWNAYQVRLDKWGSAENLAAWIAACKGHGLVVGGHCVPTKIRRDSIAFIRDGASPILRRWKTLTLAADVPANQTSGLIQTTEPPTGWVTQWQKRDVAINGEIIGYSFLKTDAPPYGLVGPFLRARNQEEGLGPQTHAAGSTVGLLAVTHDYWFELDLAGGGIQTYMAAIAETMDSVGFDYVYVDGLEFQDWPGWYTKSAAVFAMHNALNPRPLWIEASANTGIQSWPLLSMDGQIDYTYIEANGMKSEVDRNLVHHFAPHQTPFTEFMQLQLGWIELSNPTWRHTTIEELEYCLAKSIAYDVPLTIQVWLSSMRTWPHRDANLLLMDLYEQLRLSEYFSESTKLAARRSEKDFMLLRDDADNYHLEPMSLIDVGGETDLRGYLSDGLVNGARYATFWPVSADTAYTITMPGADGGSIVVEDLAGNNIPVTTVAPGIVRFTVDTRVYVRILNLPRPAFSFASAFVTPIDVR